MASETLTNPMDFKVRELLKEVQLDYSPSFTKLVDETVSAIRETIHQIPEDLHVCSFLNPNPSQIEIKLYLLWIIVLFGGCLQNQICRIVFSEGT